jgi:hypothetical protein
MAGLFAIQTYPETLSGTATKTLLQLVTPTNQRLRIWEVSFSTKGIVAADAPILVDLLIQTTAGTMTANNPAAEDPSAAETPQVTGQRDASAEPTPATVLRTWEVHPQGAILAWRASQVADAILIGGGRRVGLRVVTPGVTVLVRAYIRYEE